MELCEENGIDYVFGLPTNAVLDRRSRRPPTTCASAAPRQKRRSLRGYAETRYGAKSWASERRVVARIEASTQGLDIRFVVTSFARGSAE